MSIPPSPITSLLHAWREGDDSARDAVMGVVYEQLRTLAGRVLQGEQAGHTLQPTAIVHEAYLRLIKTDIPWEDRIHFFSLAARLMRRILVDHARTKHRAKRGGDAVVLPFEDSLHLATDDPTPVLELDAALDRLAEFDARKVRIIELYYYGGLTHEEIGAATELSVSTVLRELKMARAWLQNQLSGGRQPQ